MYLVQVKIQDSPIQGKGYFADEDIPLGTIIYCYGSKDIRVTKAEFEKLPKEKQDHLVEFAVEDEFGNWVETETGPYTNHSCDPNIMPLYIEGNYVDIAIRNIKKGEEITIDYALFFSSAKWEMQCTCGTEFCRRTVGFGLSANGEVEKRREILMQQAVDRLNKVRQPIFTVDDGKVKQVAQLINGTMNPIMAKHTKFSLIRKEN